MGGKKVKEEVVVKGEIVVKGEVGVAKGGLRGKVIIIKNRPYRFYVYRDYHDRETQKNVYAY